MKHLSVAPNWKDAINIYCAVLVNGTEEGKVRAIEHLLEIAAMLDKLNEVGITDVQKAALDKIMSK